MWLSLTKKPLVPIALLCVLLALAIILVKLCSRVPPPRQARLNYNPGRMCNSAMPDDNYSDSSEVRILVPLVEGCWSPSVTLPAWWTTWDFQLNGAGDWASVWYSGGLPVEPKFWNEQIEFYRHPSSRKLCFQGRGSLLIYTNVNERP
jgi:hypothetical protein